MAGRGGGLSGSATAGSGFSGFFLRCWNLIFPLRGLNHILICLFFPLSATTSQGEEDSSVPEPGKEIRGGGAMRPLVQNRGYF